MARELAPVPHQYPYWQDQLGEAPVLPEDPPRDVDVLVIGSGYTGLNAAIVTARGGRSTLVIDAQDVGFGCSTRNGGQISTSVKPSLGKLTAKFGEAKARAIRAEGQAALDWVGAFVEGEGIDCDFRRVGRYHAAHTPQHYESLVRDAEAMRAEEGIESFAVPRSEQRNEMGSDVYYGGVVYPKHCSIHPAKFHRGLLDLAMKAGTVAVGQCAALSIDRSGDGFRVGTTKGTISARDVIVATNGYTGTLVPWLRRRVIPIGSYIIVTEELPEALIDELFPTDRIASDTCKVIYYYRATPDRKRILFGGRVSARETDTAESAPRLYQSMCRIFPQLDGCALSHSWSGNVAYTFDELAHTGVHDGVHYAMGYCGSGVSMASYLGMRTGQKVLGLKEGSTAFDDLPHPTRPLYTGTPWFLPTAVAYYRWLDDLQCRRAKAA
ncbi:FAD-binding oxidoreductase [Pseudoruegeria sp. HB172150]|uniref:NAD(P)/FAD-dependent oxidoreductase n=1 Tax=Pseudoruegeria sp. HB172150 TaxID=2721164 RepID=UPI001557427E|nr:FAD-binding oxidoreductase [Pseudoruegeria sp. HB172150]